MNKELLLIRAKSFAYEVGSLLGVALIGAIASPEFLAIVTANAGEGILGSLIVLAFTGLVKHLRNLKIAKRLAGTTEAPRFI